MRCILQSLLLLLPLTAHAQSQYDIFSCTFNNGAKTVQVRVEGDVLTYDFGDGRKSTDLSLSIPLAEGTYLPWPGVGSEIWESVSFYNDAYTYEVWYSVERDPNGPPTAGGIHVSTSGKPVAELVCDTGSVSRDFDSLSDAMYASGMCWSLSMAEWLPGKCD